MRRTGRFLRRLADRVDYDGAPRWMGWSFKYVTGKGIVWQEDNVVNRPPKGCRVWYFPKDYEHAFQPEPGEPTLQDFVGNFPAGWLLEGGPGKPPQHP